MIRAIGSTPSRPGRHPGRTLAGVLAAVATLAVVAGVRRVVVEGDSMRPTLDPGDRLLLVRAPRPSVGDLVAVGDPRTGRLLVKRVAAVHGSLLQVRGDNPAASTDSRSFGPVLRSAVRGRVVRRYYPPQRAGRVG